MEWVVIFIIAAIFINIIINCISIKLDCYQDMRKISDKQIEKIQYVVWICSVIVFGLVFEFFSHIFKDEDMPNLIETIFLAGLIMFCFFETKIVKLIYVYRKKKKGEKIVYYKESKEVKLDEKNYKEKEEEEPVIKKRNNKRTKEKNNLEREMDLYNLEEHEKEEVRKGLFNPENFEEEDLEEDDYYYEDD